MQIEPGVKELTKKEYEERMGIKPGRVEAQEAEDVASAVGQDTEPEAEAPVSPRTRKDYIEALKERGLTGIERLKLNELKELY
jgi:hypothetical protein